MSRRKSKFAPNPELSLEELMPDRRELDRLSTESGINQNASQFEAKPPECCGK
jgi:hypothetical protein